MAFGSDIAKLLASLDLDTGPFRKGAQSVGADLNRMEGGMGRISTRSLALGTAIGTGIERLAERGIGFLFSQVQQGEESLHVLQDATAQTNAVIESTGGKAGVSAAQVRTLAESIEDLTTADDKAVQQGENLLLTFTNIGGDVFPDATKAMVNMAIAMNKGNAETADFDGAAIQLGKALNDPIKGITALRRVGVSFTADQEKRIGNLVKEGKLQEAQAVILRELTTEFGKAGEAAGTSGAAGVRRLNDAVEDTQLSLATGLAPALEEIRTDIASSLQNPATQQAIRNLGVWLGDAAKSGLAFAKTIPWGQVADGLKTAAGFAGSLIDTFAHLPPGVQGTIIALAGLNKISGGAVTGIVGELGKGLIKGVLGMTAGVVNLKAASVVGGGGGVPGVPSSGTGGGISTLGKVAIVGEAIGLVAAVAAVGQAVKDSSLAQAQDLHATLSTSLASPQSVSAIQTKLAGIDEGIAKLKADPVAAALITGPTIAELEKMRADVIRTHEEQNRTTTAVENAKGAIKWGSDKISAAAQKTAANVMSAKAAQISASDRTTRAVNAIPDPSTKVTVNNKTNVSVTANSVTKSVTTNSTWSSTQLGAFTKTAGLID